MSPMQFAKELRAILTDYNKDASAEGDRAINLALGTAMGYYLPVPASALSDFNAYWREHCEGIVNDVIECMSVQMPIKVMAVQNVAKRTLNMRYNIVHNPLYIDVARTAKIALISEVSDDDETLVKGSMFRVILGTTTEFLKSRDNGTAIETNVPDAGAKIVGE